MQRNTLQRKIILDTVIKLKTHPSIEEVYAEIQKDYPTISKTTVYRNLRQLAKNGLIRAVSLLDDLERYDGCTTQHYHFKCKYCGSIFDVEIEYLADINETVQRKYGYKVYEHELVFNGICAKCGKTAKNI